MKYNFTFDNDKLYITQYSKAYCSGICLDFSIITLEDVEKLLTFLKARKEQDERRNTTNMP